MQAHERLALLRAQGIELWAEAGALRYRAPHGVVTAQLREELRRHKADLLPLLEGTVAEDEAPMSLGQRALYFMNRLTPQSAAYSLSLAVTLHGALDVPALVIALGRLCERHPMLRARVLSEDVSQAASPRFRFDRPPLVLQEVDATSWSPAELRAHVESEASRPFLLESGEQPRAALYTCGAERHVLHLCLHHLFADGWSMQVLLRDLSALYSAARQGSGAATARAAATHHDFALAQERRTEGPYGAAALEFFKEKLADIVPLELPTDQPRPRLRSERGARVELRIGTELTGGLRALAQRLGATLGTVLLAAWQTLLGRYTGQSGFVVGVPYHGRTEARFAELVCYAVNVLPLRAELADDPPFAELVVRQSELFGQTLAHADYPLVRIVEGLRLEQDPSRTPLFQTSFAFESLPDAALTRVGLGAEATAKATAEVNAEPTAEVMLGELRLSAFPHRFGDGQRELDWIAALADGELLGHIAYSTDLFEHATIERMARHLQQLLAAVVRAPEQRLRALPLLPDDERRTVLQTFNATAVACDLTQLVPARLGQAARAHASAPAVITDEGTLLYAELDRRSNQLAQRLRSLGVGPERLVGLCMPPCPELLVGLCGILKAGGTYVPLSPDLPDERLRWLAQDSGIFPLLTDPSTRPRLLPLFGNELLLCIEEQALCGQPEEPPEVELEPGTLAYALYTSGSTGEPKAALIEHGALLNELLWLQRELGYTPQHTMLHRTPISFDLSVWELLLPLLCGAAVVLPQPGRQHEPPYLSRLIERHAVAVVQFVPSLLRIFLESAELARCGSVRLLAVGGEELPAELVDRCLGAFPRAQLYNLYGPTECTIAATTWRCERAAQRIPIGRPADNTRIYVLDENGQPVPIGVPAELYIAGLLVGRGYLNRPALTAQSFRTDPFVGEPGARMYRTGDLGRWLPAGVLQYLGRRDGQIKLRGQRIELGEIEAALRAHPQVKDCAVALLKPAADAELVAYVVPRLSELLAPALQAALRRRLPAAWVPSRWVLMTELPRTPSGKLDRKRLPPPGERASSAVHRAAATPTEHHLVQLFSSLLGGITVGVDDNFFALGGSSLLALRLLARLGGELGVELPLQEVFTAPTAALLAQRVDAAPRTPREAIDPLGPAPIRERAGRGTAAPLSAAQTFMLAQARRLLGRPYHNVPRAMWLRGELDGAALQRALDALVARHEELRMQFFTDASGADVQHPAAPLPCPLREVTLAAAEPDPRTAAERLATEEACRAFDLHTPPLIRAAVFHTGADEHLVLLVLHHIISDGTSIGIVWHDLVLLYEAERTGVPAPLPPLRSGFVDHVRKTMAPDYAARSARDVLYFLERLAGLPVLRLPLDHARPEVRQQNGSFLVAELEAEPYRALRALTAARGLTLFTGVLAGLVALIVRWSGQRSFCTGISVAGREGSEYQNVVGCFTNTLIIPVRAEDDPSFLRLTERLGEELRGALAHATAPLASVIAALVPAPVPQVPPLFQFLVASNQTDTPTWPGGVRTELALIGTGIVRRDFDVYVQERGDRLLLVLVYDVALFERRTIERQAARLLRLFTAGVVAPHTPLSRLSLDEDDAGAAPAGP
ncbi:MAG: amino acid adenylation domain-containing protein [Polyangia bacterium]